MKIKDYLYNDVKIEDNGLYLVTYFKNTKDGLIKQSLTVSGESINRGDELVFDADICDLRLERKNMTEFEPVDFKKVKKYAEKHYMKFQRKPNGR